SGAPQKAHYSNPPRYRAYSYSATQGDAVDVWVRSPDGDAVAWLLDSRYRVVTQNDDADRTTTDSHLVASKLSAGTYYVVFREYSLRAANFAVALQGSQAPAGLVWPNAQSAANSDPWIAQHHDQITEMHPRVLAINFVNNGNTPVGQSTTDMVSRVQA